jgi:GT2 family glycosyltransferase
MDKPKIAVCSMFRDSQVWFNKQTNQVYRMFSSLLEQTYGFENLNCYFLEGDSLDNTKQVLDKIAAKYNNVKILTKEATFNSVASTTNKNRIKSMSNLGSFLINQVEEDLIFWVESDLIIKPDIIQRLYDRMTKIPENMSAVVSAPCYYGIDGQFYDTWAYRNTDGTNWRPDTKMKGAGMVRMQSVGSCALIRRSNNMAINFGDGAFVELCNRVNEAGGVVFADCNQYVEHPRNEFVEGRWI